jgi:hypothetical protein
MAVTDLNSFEGGSSGTTITAGNSGGASGTAFTSVTGTCTFDNAQVMHGGLAAKFVTSATTAFVQWNTLGNLATAWFRLYVYFTANPAASTRIANFQNSSATRCGTLLIGAAGKVLFVDGAGVTQLNGAVSINLNAWNRIEGFITGSATVGQEEFKLFTTPDSTVPAETLTSAATLNTTGTIDQFVPGMSASATVTYWLDDIGVTDQGYLGPVVTAVSGPLPQPGSRTWRLRYRRHQQLPAVTAAPGITIIGTATITGAGAVSALVTEIPFAAAAGAGAVTAVATQAAPAVLAGAGAVTDVATQAVIAGLTGSGSVTAVASQSGPATATIAAAGAVTDVVTQAVIAAPAGAGAVTANVVQTATAALAGAGAVTAKVTQIAPATAAGAGAVTDVATEAVIASLAGAGSVSANASVLGAGNTAALAGAGVVTAKAVQIVTAAPAGAGALTALARQAATAALAGAGTVTAAGAAASAIQNATSAVTVTARTASGPAVAGATRTAAVTGQPATAAVTDPRDGTTQVTRTTTSSPAVSDG